MLPVLPHWPCGSSGGWGQRGRAHSLCPRPGPGSTQPHGSVSSAPSTLPSWQLGKRGKTQTPGHSPLNASAGCADLCSHPQSPFLPPQRLAQARDRGTRLVLAWLPCSCCDRGRAPIPTRCLQQEEQVCTALLTSAGNIAVHKDRTQGVSR